MAKRRRRIITVVRFIYQFYCKSEIKTIILKMHKMEFVPIANINKGEESILSLKE